MHPALLNGHVRATIIESFSGSIFVLSGGSKWRFDTLEEAQEFIAIRDWQMNVDMIHGSPLLREIFSRKDKNS